MFCVSGEHARPDKFSYMFDTLPPLDLVPHALPAPVFLFTGVLLLFQGWSAFCLMRIDAFPAGSVLQDRCLCIIFSG